MPNHVNRMQYYKHADDADSYSLDCNICNRDSHLASKTKTKPRLKMEPSRDET